MSKHDRLRCPGCSGYVLVEDQNTCCCFMCIGFAMEIHEGDRTERVLVRWHTGCAIAVLRKQFRNDNHDQKISDLLRQELVMRA